MFGLPRDSHEVDMEPFAKETRTSQKPQMTFVDNFSCKTDVTLRKAIPAPERKIKEPENIAPSQDSELDWLAKSCNIAKTMKWNAPTRVLSGEPIFEPQDIGKVINPIAKIVRMLFVDEDITKEEFHARHTEFCLRGGRLKKDINTDRNNLVRTLKRPRVTVLAFEKALAVLGLKIVDTSYTIQNTRTGTITTYKYSEADFFADENFRRNRQQLELLDLKSDIRRQ